VELPPGRWPDAWFRNAQRGGERQAKYRRPVVPLEMALYGHPDSGGIWEQHFDSKVKQFGFDRASEIWNGCYWNPKLRCFLVVYVDDLKIAGPKANVDKA